MPCPLRSTVVRVLVIGRGAREHALVLALSRDDAVTQLSCSPGNAGTDLLADNPVPDLKITDPAQVAALAEQLRSDLVVIGPEDPLVAGVAGMLYASVASPASARRRRLSRDPRRTPKEVMAGRLECRRRSRTSASTPLEIAIALDAFGAPYVVKEDWTRGRQGRSGYV